MLRRFFQGFQEGVESRRRQHVHLVDDIHLVFANLWRDTYLFNQGTDVFDRVVGSGIQLMDIIRTLFVECLARFTFIARLSFRRGMQAVDGLGKDTCAGGFSYPSRTAEQVGVRQFMVGNGIFRVVVNARCPTTVSKVDGRYLRADTI